MESISPTCLQKAFKRADPESVIFQSSYKYLFVLLGPSRPCISLNVNEIDPDLGPLRMWLNLQRITIF